MYVAVRNRYFAQKYLLRQMIVAIFAVWWNTPLV